MKNIEAVKNIINNFLPIHMLTTGITNENDELYRGESEHYQEVSSKLWRKYRLCANHHNFNIQAIQDEMVNEAKKHDVTLTIVNPRNKGTFFQMYVILLTLWHIQQIYAHACFNS